jgi:hypothetical protein
VKRVATKASAAAVARSREEKERRAQVKRLRGKPSLED